MLAGIALVALAGPNPSCCAQGTTDPSFFTVFDDPYWSPYAWADVRGSQDRALSTQAVFAPIYQDGESLLFADIRAQSDDSNNREVNWGMGLRSIFADDLILGAYGFYDYRWSQTGNQFDQITVGAELMTYYWDVRVNGYLAETGVHSAGTTGSTVPTAEYRNNTIVLVSAGSQLEQAYSGLDFELGALLSSWGENNSLELRSFVGGYYFRGSDDFPVAMGPRARLELRAFDLKWLGEQSRLTLSAEYTYDEIRDDQLTAMLAVQIPLNPFRARRLNGFQRRMIDPIRRDVDVITNTRDEGERVEDTLYADTGVEVGTVTVVDSNNDLPNAVVAAGSNSTVIVDGTEGTIQVAGTTFLQQGQTLRGAGFQVRGVETGQVATFGARPTINNSDALADTIVVAGMTTVQDLDLIGGRAGISSDPTGGSLDEETMDGLIASSILGNTVTGASESAYMFNRVDFNSQIVGNTATGSGHNGFYINNLSGAYFANNVATGSANDGIHINRSESGAIISGNMALANLDDGIELGFMVDTSFTNNTAYGNTTDGIQISYKIEDSFLSGNTSEENGEFGFLIGDVEDSTIFDNVALANGYAGFYIQELDNVYFYQNEARDTDGDDGFDLGDVYDSVLRENIAFNNCGNGFSIASLIDSTLTENEASQNERDGFNINGIEGSEISDNRATQNEDNGFATYDIDSESEMIGNYAYDNGRSGFQISDILGIFGENTAESNGQYGFQFPSVDGGRFASNVARNNGSFGFFFTGISAEGEFINNEAIENGYDSEGNLLSSITSGYYFRTNEGTFAGNRADGNANDGFAGGYAVVGSDFGFGQLAGSFSNNTANDNGDKGFVGVNSGGTVSNNTGSGNTNGSDSF